MTCSVRNGNWIHEVDSINFVKIIDLFEPNNRSQGGHGICFVVLCSFGRDLDIRERHYDGAKDRDSIISLGEESV